MTKNKHGQKHTMNLQMIEEKGFGSSACIHVNKMNMKHDKLYVETRVEELLSIVENQRISVAKKAKAIRQRQPPESKKERFEGEIGKPS